MTFNQKSFALSKPNIQQLAVSCPTALSVMEVSLLNTDSKVMGKVVLNKHQGEFLLQFFCGKRICHDPTRIWNLNWQAKSFHCLNFQRSWYNPKKGSWKFSVFRNVWWNSVGDYSAWFSPLLNQVIDQFPIGHCVSIGQKKVYPEESARAGNRRWIHTSSS